MLLFYGLPLCAQHCVQRRQLIRHTAQLHTGEIRLHARGRQLIGTGRGVGTNRLCFGQDARPVQRQPLLRVAADACTRHPDNAYAMGVTNEETAAWRDAGLTALNVSVDSLDARQFHAITGQDKFQQVMAGIDAAFDAGFEKVKVNTVLMRDVNHHQLDTFLAWIQPRPIQLRFIELMETGEGSSLFRKHHISGQVLRDELLRRGWIHQIRQRSDGPAQVFCHPDYVGEIGLIMPYEKDFCDTCNRLRVSSVGKLHLCLFGEGGVSLRDLLEDDAQQSALEERISAALLEKKQTHFLHQNNTGITQNLSYIGG